VIQYVPTDAEEAYWFRKIYWFRKRKDQCQI